MAEDNVQANIRIGIDTSDALVSIKNLQRQISAFHTSMANGSAANAASAANFQKTLIDNINATKKFSASVQTVKTTTETFTNSLEKNKLSLGQYFRYAGGASKSFGRLFATEFDTINKVARERVKDLQTQYIKMGRDANGAMKAIAVRPLVLDMDNLATKTAIAAQRQQLLNQLLKQGSTNLLNFGKNTQWAGRQLMVGFTIPLSIFGSTAAKSFMAIEDQAIRFKRVYGDLMTDSGQTDAMLESIKTLASEFTKYGVAVDKTMGLAASAAAQGKTGADLTAQVAEATRLSVLGQVEQQQALETTISVTNAFGTAAEDLASKIDFLNAVENQTVTSIEDLTIAIPKAGPVVKQLGGDVEDLAFFLTAMKEGGINASEGANALKSGLASLINPTEKASGMLAGFGININKIVESNKGDVKGIVIDFASALDKLDPLKRARAIEQLFGKFQFSRLSTLFQNVIGEGTQAQKVLDLAATSSQDLAALSSRELGKVSESSMFKFKKSIEDIKLALAPVGEIFLKLVTPVIEFGAKILDAFNSLDEKTKSFVTGLVAVVGGIGPVLLMTFGLLANGIANIIKGFTFVKNVFNKASVSSSDLGSQISYMTSEQVKAASVAASLDQVHGKLTQTFTAEASAIGAYVAALQKANTAAAAFNVPAVGRSRPMKLASGIVSVPGPKGAGDVVPAMLSPEEAVIPAKPAKKYRGLIQGIIADNIPGYEKGTQQMHLSTPMEKTPDVLRQVELGIPGFNSLDQVLQDITEVMSDLVAEKPSTLNNKARLGGMGAEQFEALWSQNPQGMRNNLRRAEEAGQMLMDEASNSIVDGMDKEIGQRVSGAIKGGYKDNLTGWLDRLIASKTNEVIEEGLVSSDPKVRNVAGGLRGRQQTVGTSRTSFTDRTTGKSKPADEEIKKLMASGLAVRRGSAVYAVGPDGVETKRRIGRPSFDERNTPEAEAIKKAQQKEMADSLREGRAPNPEIVKWRANSDAVGTYSKRAGGAYDKAETEKNKKARIAAAAEVGTAEAKARIKTQQQVLAIERNDPYNIQASDKRNSPHPQAGIDGADDAKARIAAEKKEYKRTQRRVTGVPDGKGGMSIIPVSTGPSQSAAVTNPKRSGKATRLGDLEVRQEAEKAAAAATAANTNATKEATKATRSFGSGFRNASYAVSGLSGVALMFGQNLGNLTNIVFGASMAISALTTAAEINASTGFLKLGPAAAGAKGVGGFFSRMVSVGGKAVMTLGRFAGVIGIAISAISAMVFLVNYVNDQREKERLKIEGLGDAATLTTKQLNTLGAIYGKSKVPTAFESLGTTSGPASAQDRATSASLASNEDFKKDFGQTIKTLRAATTEEAVKTFETLSLTLLAQGYEKDIVQQIINTIRVQAGKTKLDFQVASIDLTAKDGKANFKKSVEEIKKGFQDELAKPGSRVKLSPEFKNGKIVDRYLNSDALDKSIETNSANLAERLNSVQTMFNSGAISLKDYTFAMDQLNGAMTEGEGAAELTEAVFKKFTESLPEGELKTLMPTVSGAANQFLVMQASMMGTITTADDLSKTLTALSIITDYLDGNKKNYSYTDFAEANKVIAELTAKTDAAAKKQADLNKETEDYNGGGGEESAFEKAIKDMASKTKEILNQTNAFKKLKAAGYDTEEAFRIAKDPILAAALAAEKVGSKKWKALTEAIKLSKKAAEDFKKIQSQTIEGATEDFEKAYGNVTESFSALEENLQLAFNKANKTDLDLISSSESQIASLAYSIDDYNATLDDIQLQEDAINERYDKRIDALDKVQTINEEIARQQKSQLSIADALSQGDIGAAARAIQDARSEDAQAGLNAQKTNLENARNAEISGVRIGGQSRVDVEKKILDLQSQIKKIEEGSLEPAQNRIRLADEKLQKDIASLSVAGKTKDEWSIISNNIRIAKTNTDEFVTSINAALAAAQNLKNVLAENAAGSGPVNTWKEAGIDVVKAQQDYTNSSAAFKSSGLSASAYIKAVDRGQTFGFKSAFTAAGGGMVPKYFAAGGFARGTDTVPSMLTPGEFVVKKYAVQDFGIDRLKSINNGTYSGESVYNYELNVNVKSDANADDIARTVITQIKQIDSQRLRGNRL